MKHLDEIDRRGCAPAVPPEPDIEPSAGDVAEAHAPGCEGGCGGSGLVKEPGGCMVGCSADLEAELHPLAALHAQDVADEKRAAALPVVEAPVDGLDLAAIEARASLTWCNGCGEPRYKCDCPEQKSDGEVMLALCRALRAVTAERDHLRRREADIIDACERVADGGQWRADIVSAIRRVRRERDEARARVVALVAGIDRAHAALHEAQDAGLPGAARIPTEKLDEAIAYLAILDRAHEALHAVGAGPILAVAPVHGEMAVTDGEEEPIVGDGPLLAHCGGLGLPIDRGAVSEGGE